MSRGYTTFPSCELFIPLRVSLQLVTAAAASVTTPGHGNTSNNTEMIDTVILKENSHLTYLDSDDLERNVGFAALEERLAVCYVDLCLRRPLPDLKKDEESG